MNGTRAQGGAARLVVLALLVSILSQNVMGFLAGGQGLRLPGACRCAGFGFHGALLACGPGTPGTTAPCGFSRQSTHRLHDEQLIPGAHTVACTGGGGGQGANRCFSRSVKAGIALRDARMTATAPGGSTPIPGDADVPRPLGEGASVCFDGGCVMEEDQDLLDELEKELKELSETEQRLRREGAMMVLEKLRTDDGLSGRLGSIGGAMVSPESVGAPAQAPLSADDSVISQKLGGRTGPTVWSEFGALAASLKDKAINLGQGFPNWAPPDFVLEASMAAMTQGSHQYTRTAGHPSLITTLAARYSMHLEREVKPESQVAITIGASQALFLSLQTLLSPGDEVILMEPFFDLYLGQIRLAGGTPVFVPLIPRDDGSWHLDMELLRSKITPRTRCLILNSPHNPSGKVFTRQEMEAMAQIVRDNPRLSVISDEVYKYIVHTPDVDGSETLGTEGHIHFAKLPGMWDRTLTVSSAGKTFSVTGWQVGWAIGPAAMIRDMQTMLPYVQFCAATPMQESLVRCLKRADQPYEGERNYYDWLRKSYLAKRDKLAAALSAAGIIPMKGEGGFFLIGDTRNIEVPEEYLAMSTPAMPQMTRDWALCRYLAQEYNIIGIPCSPFYSPESRHLASNFVRFAFCKTDETLADAHASFAQLAQDQQARSQQERHE